MGGLKIALPLSGWLGSDESAYRFPCRGVARNRNGIPHQVCPPRRSTRDRRTVMFIIGIDPHKGSHTAAVIDHDEQLVRRVRPRRGSPAMRSAVALGRPVHAASGGRSKAQPASEHSWHNNSSARVKPSSTSPRRSPPRARLLDSGRSDKTDPHDTRSAHDGRVAPPSSARSRPRRSHPTLAAPRGNVTTSSSRDAHERCVDSTPS